MSKRICYSDSDSDGDRKQVKKQKTVSAKIQSIHRDPLKLTDLKADFLTRIFDEMHLDDLSNVALVNMQFNRLVYSYLGEKSTIPAMATIFKTPTAEWFWTSNTMGKFKFDTPSEFLTFLQTSGHLIVHLSIDCASNVHHATSYKSMERAIFKYCSDALKHIVIRSNLMPVLLNKCSKRPLQKVTELEFDACELGANFGEQLNTLFPSLRRLVLSNCRAGNPEAIEVHIRNLIDFTFTGLAKNRMVVKKANVLKTIELNPQIQRLTVDFNETEHRVVGTSANDFDLDFEFYRSVCGHLSELKWLKMFGKRRYDPLIFSDGKRIEFSNLDEFQLDNIYNQQPDQIAPFTFHHLQELRLEHLDKLSTEWMDFIIKNEHLTKLTVQLYGTVRSEGAVEQIIERPEKIKKTQLLTIFKQLKQLQELNVNAITVDPADIVAVLWKRKSLMIICLREYFMVDSIIDTFDQLTAKKQWFVDYDFENLYLKRKKSKTSASA